MRRIPALLIAAGLAAAPASAVAGPSHDPSAGPSETVEHFEWSTSRGRLGVMVMSLTPELRKHFGAPADRGVLVAHVEPDAPGAKAGLAVGDVLVEVRGRPVDSAPDVLAAIADLGKGEHVKLAVVRDGTSRALEATLATDASAALLPFDEPSWFRDWLKPFEQPPPAAGSATASNWLRQLRDLFRSKDGSTCNRS